MTNQRLRCGAVLVAALWSAPSWAVPPVITGAPITADVQPGSFFLVNLREQGVVTGTAPLQLTVGQVIVDGDPTSTSVGVQAFPGDGLPSVCLRFEDEGLQTPPQTLSVELTVVNGLNESTGPQFVNVALQPGPVVNENDPAAVAACSDPNPAPVANAGGDRTIAETDNLPGEDVTLDGSASTDADGAIVSYEWFDATETLLGTGAVLSVRLPDGDNQITLVVTDDGGNASAASVVISVAQAPTPSDLTDLPNLDPNQSEVATGLDDLCARLLQLQSTRPLTPDETDLLERCNGVVFGENVADQIEALTQLGAQDLNALRTQALTFTGVQNTTVLNRLTAVRGGAKGVSLSGLNIAIDGQYIPLGLLQASLKHALGGGASSDEPGDLLGDRWGLWFRGNYGFGEKDPSPADAGFENDQWSLTAGLDYRFSDQLVFGGALSAGRTDVTFKPSGRGGLDTDQWSFSLYGSSYAARSFYVDALVSYGRADYETDRHIVYTDPSGLIDRRAAGDTDGETLSAALGLGYDLVLGAFTLTPNVGYVFVETDVDGFTESGASGLNLAYEEQSYRSSTATAGLRMSYAWPLKWGVLSPYVRTDYVREFQDNIETFAVRFAADPFADDPNPTAPIIVSSEVPDTSYWRFSAGASAQFPFGLSGFIEYQRLESLQYVTFEEVIAGLRLQRAF